MIAAHRLSLKFATPEKLARVTAVLERYRATVNAYIHHVWEHGGSLDKETQDTVPLGHLSFRMRSHALQHALGIVAATRASGRALGKVSCCPVFRGGMTLSKQLAELVPARKQGAFDFYLRVSTLSAGNRVDLPLKGTRHLRKLLAVPGAKLKAGGTIGGRPGRYWLTVWVELLDLPDKTEGRALGLDIGLNKLVAASDGAVYGTEMRGVVARVRRRKPGSKGKRRARRTRDEFINRTLNQLPWNELKLVAVERLKNLKKGKKPGRSKQFRKALAPWTYAYVLRRIEWKARLNRVQRVEVNPAYTSQKCPSCSHRAKSSRVNEMFTCVRCGYTADADFVGSLNILARAIGEPMVPQPCAPPSGSES